jgi:hypothetical protein
MLNSGSKVLNVESPTEDALRIEVVVDKIVVIRVDRDLTPYNNERNSVRVATMESSSFSIVVFGRS